MKGLAEAGQGQHYFVGDNEGSALQAKVIDALSKTDVSCLGNIALDFPHDCVHNMVPSMQHFPILTDQTPFIVFAELAPDFPDSEVSLSFEHLLTK